MENFFFLLISSVLSTLAVLPYVLTNQVLAQIKMPIYLFILGEIFRALFFYAIFIFVGLYFASKINFELPILEAYFNKQEYKQKLKSIAKLALILGITLSFILVGLEKIFSIFIPDLAKVSQNLESRIWPGLLASFYGGICEEILLRLLAMSFLVWVIYKIKKNDISVWVAIFVSSILFGLGHLPMMATLSSLTPLIIIRTILLNAIGGVCFGWLYWKKGLESAMITHFIADVILHAVLPLISKIF